MAIFPVNGEILPITILSSVTPGALEPAILVSSVPMTIKKNDNNSAIKILLFMMFLLLIQG
jgi:hypothetical protein